MDILQDIRTSVTQSIDASLDRACRRLDGALALCDAKAKEANQRAKHADEERRKALERVRELEEENTVIHDDLRQYEVAPEELEELKLKNEKILMLEKYAPERVLSNAVDDLERGRALELNYRPLYSDTQMLVEALGEMTAKLYQQRKKLLGTLDYFRRDEFTLALKGGGGIATFRRVRVQPMANNGKACEDREQQWKPKQKIKSSETVGRAADAKSSTRVSSPPVRKTTSSYRTTAEADMRNGIDHGRSELPCAGQSDLASTQSDSEDNDTHGNHPGDTTVRPSACEGRVAPSPEARRISISHHDRHDSDAGVFNPEAPVVIKSESTPSSSLQNLSSIPAGTQDLEEVGATVRTPTKRAANTNPGLPVSDRSASAQNHYCHNCQGRNQNSRPEQNLLRRSLATSSIRDANVLDYEAARKRRKIEAIPLVTEDGDESSPDQQATETRDNLAQSGESRQSNVKLRPAHGRLENLLEGASPGKSPLVPRKSVKWSASANDGHSDSDDRTKRDSPTKGHARTPNGSIEFNQGIRSDNGHQNCTSDTVKGLPEVRPEEEPFRARPVHKLNLEDFKINPKNNQGYDFSYKSVVRRREERKCLSGCVSENCCGPILRDMARHLPCQEDEGRRILEEYLGDEHHIISEMSDDDRGKVLLEAKTWFLANRHGRHRNNQQRPRSPPGFWRADMPTTQELERDREEAKKLERRMVEDRRREAMRPSGLWKFADE